MQKTKTRPADFLMNTPKIRMDLPVVLSLAGIVSIAAVIGGAAFHSGIFSQGTRYLTTMVTTSNGVKRQAKSDLAKEFALLNKKLAKVSSQLQHITETQSTTVARVDKMEDAFSSITAAIPSTAPVNSSPYHRLLDTGWNADDMVTRTQKRDRITLLKTQSAIDKKDLVFSTKPPEQTRYAVELASYENIITARNAWQKLTKSHGTLLGKLEPHLLPVLGAKNKNGRVKLIIGPIKTATKAAQVCSALRSNGQSCQERLFSTSNITVVSAPKNNGEISSE